MDDSYLIHEDIDYLKYCLAQIKVKLKGLQINLNKKTAIVKFDGGSFTFLKRRFFFCNSGKIVTRLKRQNITTRRRVIRKLKKKDVSIIDITQSFNSWYGYANKWDAGKTVYNMRRELA